MSDQEEDTPICGHQESIPFMKTVRMNEGLARDITSVREFSKSCRYIPNLSGPAVTDEAIRTFVSVLISVNNEMVSLDEGGRSWENFAQVLKEKLPLGHEHLGLALLVNIGLQGLLTELCRRQLLCIDTAPSVENMHLN